jgi:ribonuclease Y
MIVALLAGVGIGALLVRALNRGQVQRARDAAEQVVNDARAEVERLSTRARQEAEHVEVDLEREAAEELEAEQQRLAASQADIEEREGVLHLREQVVAELTKEVRAKEHATQDNREEVKRLGREREAVLRQHRAKLEEVGGLTADAAIEQIVKEQVEHAQHRAQMQLHQQEELAKEDATGDARRVMATVVDRLTSESHLERVQNVIEIPDSRTLAVYADATSPAYRTFLEETGCDLMCDEPTRTATVRGDDPLGREVARRVLRQIANRSISAPDRIRAIAAQVKIEVDREVQNAGRKAVRMMGLGKVHPEIMHLVGRLKFRLSYSQNQWKHAVEVATIAGMLAEELGLDRVLARRGGLLHDIGKAMTHEREGSHAVLGAEVARRCGEPEVVANVIGSHHNDEPMQSPIAYLVTAADALSGARPGARRESVTQYISRIEEIQDVASRSRAVRRVDVMHAGREVRVIVAGDQRGEIDDAERHEGVVLSDAELHPLAESIARDLEKEVQFAGQIKVTVIRESRAVSIAT